MAEVLTGILAPGESGILRQRPRRRKRHHAMPRRQKVVARRAAAGKRNTRHGR